MYHLVIKQIKQPCRTASFHSSTNSPAWEDLSYQVEEWKRPPPARSGWQKGAFMHSSGKEDKVSICKQGYWTVYVREREGES